MLIHTTDMTHSYVALAGEDDKCSVATSPLPDAKRPRPPSPSGSIGAKRQRPLPPSSTSSIEAPLPLPSPAGSADGRMAEPPETLCSALLALRADGTLQQTLATGLRNDARVRALPTGRFQRGMALLLGDPASAARLRGVAARVALPPASDSGSLGRALVIAALEVFVGDGQNDYFLLHACTAAWALARLLPLLGGGSCVGHDACVTQASRAAEDGERMRIARSFLATVAAAFVVQGSPPLEARFSATAAASLVEVPAANALSADALPVTDAPLADSPEKVPMRQAEQTPRERAAAACASIVRGPLRNEHIYKLTQICCEIIDENANVGVIDGQGSCIGIVGATGDELAVRAIELAVLSTDFVGRTGERPLKPVSAMPALESTILERSG